MSNEGVSRYVKFRFTGMVCKKKNNHVVFTGIKSLRDMTNSQAFCALINTFIPDTFSNEILLRDRWAFNLALKTFEKMTHLQSPVTAEGNVSS